MRKTHQRTWKPRFLKVLRSCANVQQACNLSGVPRSTVYHARKTDPDFAAEWDAAHSEALDWLEWDLRQQAMNGWLEPVTFNGKVVGTRRKFNNKAAMFLLKAHRYRS